MKRLWLAVVVVCFAINSVLAADAPKAADKDAVSPLETLTSNPDDVKAINALLLENARAISELIDSSPEEATKKLADALATFDTLKPESAEAKLLVTRAKLTFKSLGETIELSQTSLADLEKQLDEKPEDATVLRKYSRKLSMEIGSIARAEPDKAEALLQAAQERAAKLKENATEKAAKLQVESLERLLTSFEKTIEHGRELAALIGQSAAPLDIEDWVNGSPLTSADLEGKVVLLDFWAVWCGPCLATFPHLREWQAKYSEKGLVIIGLTRYYDYEWQEGAERPTRAKDKEKVPHETEQEMLKRFAELHSLQHRFAIQTDGHNLAAFYAVKGIPQAVLIDQKGVIRLVRVGSGKQNAQAIGKMLEKLFADTPVAAGQR